MKKILILFSLLSFYQIDLNAQCPPYPPATGCAFASPNCEGVDGYCNTLVPQITITEPLPGCGGTAVINNDDWIAFYAGSTNISIQITPSNCLSQNPGTVGIQGGIYGSCDVDGGVNNDGIAFIPMATQCACTQQTFILSADSFVIDQVYYLVIDGCGGDICDYEIAVLEGITGGSEITGQVGDIEGPDSLCVGEIVTFSVDTLTGATYYDWEIIANASIYSGQGTTELEILVEDIGEIEICVSASSSCYAGGESCLSINNISAAQNFVQQSSLCEGDSILFEGEYFSTSGYYSFDYTNVEGCDSIHSLDLSVFENYEFNYQLTLCEGLSYELGGNFYTENGNYDAYLTSSEGCDSIIFLDLEFVSEYKIFIDTSICEGEIWGNGYDVTGFYTIYLISSGGCDSTIYLDLTVLEVPEEVVIDTTICNGEAIIIGNEIYTQPGNYSDTLTLENGCDNLINLTLTVLPSYSTVFDTLLEPGELFNGVLYENDTSFIEYFTAQNGCDSTSIIVILIDSNDDCPPYPPTIGCGLAEPNCENGLEGYCNTLAEQTEATEVMPGCGGTAVLNNDDWIAFYPGSTLMTIVITPSNCVGQGGNIGIQAGIYAACDENGGANGAGVAETPISIHCTCTTAPITLSYHDFNIGDAYYLVVDGCGGDICDYDISVIEGFSIIGFSENTGSIQSPDSVCVGEILTLSTNDINPSVNYNWVVDSNAVILNGQGTSELELEIINEGTIEICVTAENICSNGGQVCTNLTSFGEVINTTINQMICEGDSIEFEGEYFTETGFYSFNYVAVNGCDSIINLDLTVNANVESSLDTILCEGLSFEIGDSIYVQSGIYENLLVSSTGCDSTLIIDLEFVENFETFLTAEICEGTSYTIWDTVFTEAGDYTNIVQANGGCDSILNLTIDVLPNALFSVDTILQPGGVYDGTVYDTDTTIMEIYAASNGCDSIVSINIFVETDGIEILNDISDIILFPNPVNQWFVLQFTLKSSQTLSFETFDIIGQKVDFKERDFYNKGEHQLQFDASGLESGAYFLNIKTDKDTVLKRFMVMH